MRTLNYAVPAEDEGRRVDRVLKSRLSLSARQLARAKAAGTICLDGEPVHVDRAVHAGQHLSVELQDEGPSFELKVSNAPVEIVYEDEDLYVVNKCAPLATQSSPGQPGDALENRLAGYFHDPAFVFRPVNRLDRGTSGLMAAAKNAHAQARLNALLHTPAFTREYLAVVEGRPDPPAGRIDAPIGHAEGESVRREVRPDGKPSQTNYEVIKTRGGLSLVHLILETGRTHQIRVHMAHIGCPVFGDYVYGTAREDVLPGRFALHSAKLSFTHPVTGAQMIFSAPLPAELERLMEEDADG